MEMVGVVRMVATAVMVRIVGNEESGKAMVKMVEMEEVAGMEVREVMLEMEAMLETVIDV